MYPLPRPPTCVQIDEHVGTIIIMKLHLIPPHSAKIIHCKYYNFLTSPVKNVARIFSCLFDGSLVGNEPKSSLIPPKIIRWAHLKRFHNKSETNTQHAEYVRIFTHSSTDPCS